MRDIDIRLELRAFLKEKFSLEEGGPFVLRDEFGICQGAARIDVAVVNGHLHGYEIKSEEDTLRRLDSQLGMYSLVFDYLTFVVSQRHFNALEEGVPSWCGLMVASPDADGSVILRTVRGAQSNPGTDPHELVKLLWRDEAIKVLRRIGRNKGIESKPRKVLWDVLATSVPPRELGEYVRDTLKARVWISGPAQG